MKILQITIVALGKTPGPSRHVHVHDLDHGSPCKLMGKHYHSHVMVIITCTVSRLTIISSRILRKYHFEQSKYAADE